MTTIQTVEFDASKHHGTALQDKTGAVYITVAPKRWDLATWLWWWLAPWDQRVWVTLNTTRGQRVRTRAVRIARRIVAVRQTLQAGEDEPTIE